MSFESNTVLKTLYRLLFPGSLLLLIAVVLIKLGVVLDPESRVLRLLPIAVFVAGLALSAVFRRSRIFFALLALALAQAALAVVTLRLSPATAHIVGSIVGILLPLNLLAMAFLKERGIISPPGRRRLAAAAAQVIGVAILCLPQLAPAAQLLERSFFPETLSAWSHLAQPAMACFLLAVATIAGQLVRRYNTVESGLLWALLASWIALGLGGNSSRAGVFFAAAGATLLVALLETSYKMAYHDELTRLPSRRALNEAMMKLPVAYTVAMLDVDHFKKFNDAYGHEAGDQALRLVASRLAHIAGGGRAYRYGGEEFAVLFPGKPPDEVTVYLDRMRRVIEQSTFVVRGKDRRKGRNGKTRIVAVKKQTNVTVSIGVASSNGGHLTPSEVLRVADHALYRAKAKGRNCTVAASGGKGPDPVRPSMRIVGAS
ncbi:MAG TPA: GGDEF domain-containing protein [Candidatus Angelobacter sp.]|nr:GGDEF domain-containing protein [Candidatus Angelobacter sp.]